MSMISIDLQKAQKIFTEWARRVQANPEEFDLSIIDESPEEYGASASKYFFEIAETIQ